jgi:hypothetical protein
MRDNKSLHLKAQELADCYKSTDYLREMSVVSEDEDPDEGALKWIALAILHGVNSNAESVSIRRSEDGTVTVLAEYRRQSLPSPGGPAGEKAIKFLRSMVDLELDKDKRQLAFGWGNESLDLEVKANREAGGDTVTIHFPE